MHAFRAFINFASGSSMSNLARTYCVLGRHQDALRLDINAYEHLKRALAADDPRLGAHDISLEFYYVLTQIHQLFPCTILGCRTVKSAGATMRWCCLSKHSTFGSGCCLRIILK
jgi:hypothetical protein